MGEKKKARQGNAGMIERGKIMKNRIKYNRIIYFVYSARVSENSPFIPAVNSGTYLPTYLNEHRA